MHTALRPYVTSGVALVGASVIAATPILATPLPDGFPAPSTVAVQPTSLVSDFLDNIGNVIGAASGAVEGTIGTAVTLPVDVALLAGFVLQNPQQLPNLVSFLATTYITPANIDTFIQTVVRPLAEQLASPLGPTATDPGLILTAANEAKEWIASMLAKLPDPGPVLDAYVASLQSPIVTLFRLAAAAVLAPVTSFADVATHVAKLPAQLVHTFEAAVANPASIPGLFSGLVYSLVNPQLGSGSLLSEVIGPFIQAADQLIRLPGSSTGLIGQAYQVFANVASTVLGVLPAPIMPTATAAAAAAAPAASPAAQATEVQATVVQDVATPPVSAARTVTLDVTTATDADEVTSTADDRDAVETAATVEALDRQAVEEAATGDVAQVADDAEVEPAQQADEVEADEVETDEATTAESTQTATPAETADNQAGAGAQSEATTQSTADTGTTADNS